MIQHKYQILIVSSAIDGVHKAETLLQDKDYGFSYATNGEDAYDLLEDNHFDLLLLDSTLADMDALNTTRQIKSEIRYNETSIIFLIEKSNIDSIEQIYLAGATDYILRPCNASELVNKINTCLELKKANALLRYHNIDPKVSHDSIFRPLSELENAQKEMIFILTELIESISDETNTHIRRVAEYSRLLALHHHSISQEEAQLIYHASTMHDIGKITIPEEILNKETLLSDEEFDLIKSHTTRAHEFLQNSDQKILRIADIIAYEHHEQWDGEGYPRGLVGEEIHLYGRIVALADVFDALTHKRAYKDAWSVDEAVKYIIENSETQFDPYLVEIFKEHLDEFLLISDN